MEWNSHYYGTSSREKKEFNGEKMTIIFPFLLQMSILKIFLYLGRGEEMGGALYGRLKNHACVRGLWNAGVSESRTL